MLFVKLQLFTSQLSPYQQMAPPLSVVLAFLKSILFKVTFVELIKKILDWPKASITWPLPLIVNVLLIDCYVSDACMGEKFLRFPGADDIM